MNEKKELIYLAAYTVIRKMLEEKVIDKTEFDRLNIRMAAQQNCRPVIG